MPNSPPATLTESLQNKFLVTGSVNDFGYLSAIREVTAIERAPGFQSSRKAYEAIVDHLEEYARQAGPDFSQCYHEVAAVVKAHAQSLKN